MKGEKRLGLIHPQQTVDYVHTCVWVFNFSDVFLTTLNKIITNNAELEIKDHHLIFILWEGCSIISVSWLDKDPITSRGGFMLHWQWLKLTSKAHQYFFVTGVKDGEQTILWHSQKNCRQSSLRRIRKQRCVIGFICQELGANRFVIKIMRRKNKTDTESTTDSDNPNPPSTGPPDAVDLFFRHARQRGGKEWIS